MLERDLFSSSTLRLPGCLCSISRK
uniref:Uncharacterized protein n=1 Tax=Arundo donax TaxID=35708 RepID=A0A0A9H9N4_ARUDO